MKLDLKKRGQEEIILEDKLLQKHPRKCGDVFVYTHCYNKTMAKNVIIILFFIFLTLLFVNSNKKKDDFVSIKHQNAILLSKVAKTNDERIRGLSGKESLGYNEALLFVFDKEDNYGIWMKDMNFSIDIAWLDKNKKIIYIENNVSPETFPKTFYPTNNEFGVKALYVLETNANFFLENNIKVGDFLDF